MVPTHFSFHPVLLILSVEDALWYCSCEQYKWVINEKEYYRFLVYKEGFYSRRNLSALDYLYIYTYIYIYIDLDIYISI